MNTIWTNFACMREARKAFLALSEDAKAPVAGPTQVEAEDDMASAAELSTDGVSQLHKSTPVYVLNPKQDMHGLGYDPFKGAPEFRENKRSHLPGNKESGHQRKMASSLSKAERKGSHGVCA
ncbi:G patch domain-containing protein TGH isoform X1 [Lactuca sativa]|uniref:G patch domain-containing protein TGH isoform X1 n=1 Tax=Lactuca sativa TaxID=4236 RepID=UPI0022B07E08|nr:G patch domain-containing protein TGH isoform X1 [Lactuca sativa]XP_052626302.1 G patch domain-containing protein TGH isoform X1 [Lactuca sativa]